jgi:hypothetical protein
LLIARYFVWLLIALNGFLLYGLVRAGREAIVGQTFSDTGEKRAVQ